jgi:hypothetical protein
LHTVDRVARLRFLANAGAVVAAGAAALVLAVDNAGAGQRCCFLVDAAASGHAVATAGADLERPGAYVYRARWSWRVRRLARYVQHGRIFNALTTLGARPSSSLVSLRFSEMRESIHGPTCRRRLERRLTVRADRAYVPLEDALDGRIALVVRAHLPALRAGCNAAFAVPAVHVTRAPAGVTLRRAPSSRCAGTERLGFSGAAATGVPSRFTFVSASFRERSGLVAPLCEPLGHPRDEFLVRRRIEATELAHRGQRGEKGTIESLALVAASEMARDPPAAVAAEFPFRESGHVPRGLSVRTVESEEQPAH